MLIETLQQVNFYLFFKYLRRVGMARFYLEISIVFFFPIHGISREAYPSQRYSRTKNETAQLVSQRCHGYHLRYVTARVPATEGMLGKSCVYITANSHLLSLKSFVSRKSKEGKIPCLSNGHNYSD